MKQTASDSISDPAAVHYRGYTSCALQPRTSKGIDMHAIEFTHAAPAAIEPGDFNGAASSARAAALWADGLSAPGTRVQQLRIASTHVSTAVERASSVATRSTCADEDGDMELVSARALGMLHAARDSIDMSMFVPAQAAPSPSSRTAHTIEIDAYSVECAVAYLRTAAADLDALAHLAAFEAASLDDLLGGLLSIPV